MCSVNLGEALYLEMRVRGVDNAGHTIEQVRRELEVIHPDWELVAAAASPSQTRSASPPPSAWKHLS